MPEKYQQEIEDILDQVSSFPKQRRTARKRSLLRMILAGIGQSLVARGWGLSPGRIMLGAFVLLLLAWWFKSSLPGLMGPMLWVALLLFILGYAFFFISPGATYEKRWRGQLVEPTMPWWERLRRRTKGR
jgi:hypothetical protein